MGRLRWLKMRQLWPQLQPSLLRQRRQPLANRRAEGRVAAPPLQLLQRPQQLQLRRPGSARRPYERNSRIPLRCVWNRACVTACRHRITLFNLLQSTVVALPRLFWPERYHAAYSDALSERGLAEDGSGWLSIVAPQHALWQFHPARAELMYSRAQAAVAALHAQRRAIIERLRVLPGGTADRNSVLSALLAPPSLSRVLPKTAALSAGQAAAAPSGSIDAMLMALRTSRPVAGEAGEPTDGIACIAPAIAGSQLRFGKAALGAHAAAEPMSDPALTSVSGWVESDVPLPDLAELVLSVAKRSAVVRTSVVLNGLLGRQLSEVVRVRNVARR